MVQRLGLPASNAGGTGSNPGWGIKILHAKWHGKKKKKKKILLSKEAFGKAVEASFRPQLQ